MAHTPLTVETVHGSTQVSVRGLLQLTVMSDGSVQIDLDGKRIEVERNMSRNQLIIRHERDDVIDAPAKTVSGASTPKKVSHA
jgi:hypothetical protein